MDCHAVGQHPSRVPLPAPRLTGARTLISRQCWMPTLHRVRRRPKGSTVRCSMLSAPDILFTVTTVATIPIYSTMIAFPGWRQTSNVLKSRTAMLGACFLHAAAFVVWWCSGALQGAGKALAHQRVAWFAGLLNSKEFTCLAWTHLLLLDLFQARYANSGPSHPLDPHKTLSKCWQPS
mmetsp:Transcript_17366/g.51956  ORF Transcript_17366/g.51956 Transcript_17366/m.51956 type:complete len:178 (+) Transcript_17366:164-697(+)